MMFYSFYSFYFFALFTLLPFYLFTFNRCTD